MSETVAAVGIHRFGGPEELSVVEIPRPKPVDGQVRIRVAAATVNPADVLFRAGGVAAALTGARPPYIAGLELAGTVESSPGHSRWSVGDRVAAITHFTPDGRGAQAEEVVVPSDSVLGVPDVISLEAAATIPMNGLTARLALDTLALTPGDTLAVTGAAGALGGYVVELAREAGLRVIGVVGRDDADLVTRLGCDDVVPRGDDAPAAVRALTGAGVDGLVDAALVGAPMLEAVRDGGGFIAARRPGPEPLRSITVSAISVSVYQHNAAALAELGEMAAAGRLTTRVAATYAPDQAARAHERLERGGTRGRLLLDFS